MQRHTASVQPHASAKRRRYRPDALMYVTAAFLWVSVWRFQDMWPIVGKLQIPMALEVGLCIALAANLSGPRHPRWFQSRILVIPFILLGVMIVGIPSSIWMGKAVTFVIKDFAPSVLLMMGVAASLRDADDLNWLAFAHLIGATVYSIWTYLFVSVGSDGRLGGASYYDANDLALLLVCTIPFAIYFLRPSLPGWKRIFALFSLALYVEMLIKSGSRGGFIAFIILMAYVVVAFRSIRTTHRIAAVVVAAVVMLVFGSATYWNMMKTIVHPDSDYNMTEQTGRKFIWKRGVGYMLQHPLLGVGAANFEQAEGMLSAISQQYASENRGLKWSAAHNSFVLVGAELGVGGLILFVTMIGTSFYHLAQIKDGPQGDPRVTPEDTAFAQTLIASLIGYCISGFFVSASYFSLLYALIGFVIAEDSFRRRRKVPAGGRIPLHHPTSLPPRKQQYALTRTHWAPTG